MATADGCVQVVGHKEENVRGSLGTAACLGLRSNVQ